jgi:GDP-L-fucose synthase
MNKNYTFLVDNIKINLNIVENCKKYGVKRLINILSTCIFPDKDVTYPLTSEQLHNGLPHNSNIGYAYSKRVLHLASKLLVESGCKETDFQVVNLTPTNLYGEYDNYELINSHVIPGLIHKTYLSNQSSTKKITLFGSGNAKRQFLYVDDLSRVILEFLTLKLESNEISCIVSPPESDEIKIKDLLNKICNIFNYTGEIVSDTSYSDGQYRKTSNNDELKKYLKDFKFTSLDDGLKNTITFFIENYNIVRK